MIDIKQITTFVLMFLILHFKWAISASLSNGLRLVKHNWRLGWLPAILFLSLPKLNFCTGEKSPSYKRGTFC